MWRIWGRGLESLEALDRWTVDEVLDANEALDVRDAAQEATTPPRPLGG